MALLRWLDRWPRWAAIGLPTVIAGVCAWIVFDTRVYNGGDNVFYWALGRSLVENFAYRDLVAPGEPFETSVPWGYPAVLAVAMWILPEGYGYLKWVSWSCMVGAFACLAGFLLHLLRGHRGIALVILVICAMDCRLLIYGSLVLSEAPFFLLSTGALLAFEAFRQRWPDRLWGVLPAAALASCAYLVRPIGVALVVALLGALLLGRRWRALAVALLVVMAVDGSWHVRCALRPSEQANLYLNNLSKQSKYQTGDEKADLTVIADRLVHNVAAYTDQPMKELTLGYRYRGYDFFYWGVVLWLFAVLGYVVTLSRAGPVHLYLPLYILALMAWLPEVIKTRYLALVFPFLLALALLGLWRLLAVRWPRVAALAVLVVALVLMSFQGAYLRQAAHRYADLRQSVRAGDEVAGRSKSVRSYVEMCRWAETGAAPQTVLAVRNPRLAYYYSGNKAVRVTQATDPGDVFAWLVGNRIDYVLLDRLDWQTKKTRDRFKATIRAHPDHFMEVYRTPSGDRIMRFHPEPSQLTDEP